MPFGRVFSRQLEKAVFIELEVSRYLEIRSNGGGEGIQRRSEEETEPKREIKSKPLRKGTREHFPGRASDRHMDRSLV